ncbi:hypothetical protein [Gluconobacter cerinus]|uniref:hypothetical protein n=1 Tax=Gluconobacter cerinus TaxID=38307 RepID=UPI001C05ABAE|nr:hypothetical protein [Gluconobacter cerinus]
MRIFKGLCLLALQLTFGVTAAVASDTTTFVPSTSCATYLEYANRDKASVNAPEARNRVISAMKIMQPYMTEFASLHLGQEVMGQIMRNYFIRLELECHSHHDQLLSQVIPKVGNGLVDNLNDALAHSGVKTQLSYPSF